MEAKIELKNLMFRAIDVMHNIWTCLRVPGEDSLQWSRLFVSIKLSDEERKREKSQGVSRTHGNLVHVQIHGKHCDLKYFKLKLRQV